MELYDFINNDLPNLFKENEGADAVSPLQSGGDSFTPSREVLLERVASLENHIAELEKDRSDLAAKLRVEVTDKEEVLGRIASLENLADALEQQRSALEMQLQALSAEKDNALREADSMLKGKASEIEQLKIDISSLRQELSETITRLERVETEKRASVHELERVRQNFSEYIKKTKRAIVIACIMVLVLAVVFSIYYMKNRIIEPKPAGRPAAADNRTGKEYAAPQARIRGSENARWPGKPIALNVGNFRVSVIPLRSGTLNRLPAALRHEETKNYCFYIVKIKAGRGNLSEEFLKSPSIDFINRNNAHAVQTGAGSVLRVVHASMSGRRHTNRRTILLQCLVALRNDFQPIGIIIGPLNKETLEIVIV